MRLALCIFMCAAAGAASWGQEAKSVRVLRGHKSSVRVIEFSPDSKFLASSQDGGNVRLWDASSGQLISTLYDGSYCCESLAFSPDGKMLAGGSECRWVWLWDVATHTKVGSIETTTFFSHGSCVAFQPGSKSLVSRSCDGEGLNRAIAMSDVATLKNTGAVTLDIGDYRCMAFSPGCRLVAVGNLRDRGNGDAVALYETRTGRKVTVTSGFNGRAVALTFSPDGKTLATAIDETVKLWDVATGKNLSTFAVSNPIVRFPGVKGFFKNYVYCIAFSPNSSFIAFGNSCDPVVELWDVATGKKITALKGKPLSKCDGIASVAISPDGKTLAAGRFAGSGNWDETIELWDIGGLKLKAMSIDSKKPASSP